MINYRLILLSTLLFCSAEPAHSQSTEDLIISSKMMGKSYYTNGDFFNAFKYLQAFKYLDYKRLSAPKNAGELDRLEKVILYCESKVKEGLTSLRREEIKTYTGRGFASEMDSVKAVLSRPAPKL